jgi:hypothetical protein
MKRQIGRIGVVASVILAGLATGGVGVSTAAWAQDAVAPIQTQLVSPLEVKLTSFSGGWSLMVDELTVKADGSWVITSKHIRDQGEPSLVKSGKLTRKQLTELQSLTSDWNTLSKEIEYRQANPCKVIPDMGSYTVTINSQNSVRLCGGTPQIEKISDFLEKATGFRQ